MCAVRVFQTVITKKTIKQKYFKVAFKTLYYYNEKKNTLKKILFVFACFKQTI